MKKKVNINKKNTNYNLKIKNNVNKFPNYKIIWRIKKTKLILLKKN